MVNIYIYIRYFFKTLGPEGTTCLPLAKDIYLVQASWDIREPIFDFEF